MNIRYTQLSLFDPAAATMGGVRAAWNTQSRNGQHTAYFSRMATAATSAPGVLGNLEIAACLRLRLNA